MKENEKWFLSLLLILISFNCFVHNEEVEIHLDLNGNSILHSQNNNTITNLYELFYNQLNNLHFENSFINSFKADPITDNFLRETKEKEILFSYLNTFFPYETLHLIHINAKAFETLGIPVPFVNKNTQNINEDTNNNSLQNNENISENIEITQQNELQNAEKKLSDDEKIYYDKITQILSSQTIPSTSKLYSTRYGSFVNGKYVDNLGDGKSLSWGQFRDLNTNKLWEITSKGTGKTPFSFPLPFPLQLTEEKIDFILNNNNNNNNNIDNKDKDNNNNDVDNNNNNNNIDNVNNEEREKLKELIGKINYENSGKEILLTSAKEYLTSVYLHELKVDVVLPLAIAHSSQSFIPDAFDVYLNYNQFSFYSSPDLQKEKKGGIITRAGESWIRFGTFQSLSKDKDKKTVQKLAEYVIENYYPHLINSEKKYFDFLKEVVKRTATMFASWHAVGFCHGLLNSDSMSVLGTTMEVGASRFQEIYDPGMLCNPNDEKERRYSFSNQVQIGMWNLHKFAESFLPIITPSDQVVILGDYYQIFQSKFLQMMKLKMGLGDRSTMINADVGLVDSLMDILEKSKIDYTKFFRVLSDHVTDHLDENQLFPAGFNSFFKNSEDKSSFKFWWKMFIIRFNNDEESVDVRQERMWKVNPIYSLRSSHLNYVVDEIEKEGNYTSFQQYFDVLSNPFEKYQNKIAHKLFFSPPKKETSPKKSNQP